MFTPLRNMHPINRLVTLVSPKRGKRRVWDEIDRLRDENRQLKTAWSNQANHLETQRTVIDNLLHEKHAATAQLKLAMGQLEVALAANEANHDAISVPMMVRDTRSSLDQATEPLPIVTPISDRGAARHGLAQGLLSSTSGKHGGTGVVRHIPSESESEVTTETGYVITTVIPAPARRSTPRVIFRGANITTIDFSDPTHVLGRVAR